MSSLKNGVTKEIIKRKIYVEDDRTLQAEEFEDDSSNKKGNFISRTFKKLSLSYKNYKKNKIINKMADNFHYKIINQADTTRLFTALKRMQMCLYKIDFTKIPVTNKVLPIIIHITLIKCARKGQKLMEKRELQEQQEFNTNIIGSHILNIQEEKSIHKLENELEQMDQSVIQNLEDVIDRAPKEYMNPNSQLETVREVDDEESPRKQQTNEYEKVGTGTKDTKGVTQDYLRLMSAYDEENLSELFMEIFSIFDILEAGNVTINDIFSLKQKYQRKAFEVRIFALILNVFIRIFLLNSKFGDLTLLQKYSQTLKAMIQSIIICQLQQPFIKIFPLFTPIKVKLNEFLKRFKKTINSNQKSHQQTTFSQLVYKDLNTIHNIFTDLLNRLNANFGKTHQTQRIDLEEFDSQGEFDTNRSNQEKKGLFHNNSNHNNLEIKQESKEFMSAFQLERLIGSLIPLTCGHNGYLKQNEILLYELHLRNAGFIPLTQSGNSIGLSQSKKRTNEDEVYVNEIESKKDMQLEELNNVSVEIVQNMYNIDDENEDEQFSDPDQDQDQITNSSEDENQYEYPENEETSEINDLQDDAKNNDKIALVGNI